MKEEITGYISLSKSMSRAARRTRRERARGVRPFLLVGKFPLAGFPNSTPLDNVLLWLGIFAHVRAGAGDVPVHLVTPGWIGAPKTRARAHSRARSSLST